MFTYIYLYISIHTDGEYVYLYLYKYTCMTVCVSEFLLRVHFNDQFIFFV